MANAVGSEGQAGPSDGARNIKCFDEHGFAIFEDNEPDTERCHAYDRIPLSNSDLEAWKKLFLNWGSYRDRSNGKLQAMVRMGVPAKFRASLWCKLLDIEALQNTSHFCYQTSVMCLREQLVDVGVSEYGGRESLTVLCEVEEDTQNAADHNQQYHNLSPGGSRVSLSCLRQIMLDLDRTYPTHRMFMGDTEEAKEGRAALFRILAVYALYNPANGYCQGMSYLAGLLLMTMGEVEAFWCLVALLEKKTYLAGYYEMSLARIQNHAAVFDRMLQIRFPKVRKHLKQFGLETLMFVTPWFLCTYTNLPCWDSVLAVWDVLMLEGNTALFRVAIAVLDLYQFDLLKVHELAKLLPMLLHLPHHVVQRKVLMPIVWETSVQSQEVEQLNQAVQQENAVTDGNVLKRKQEWLSSPSVFEFTGSPSKRKKRRLDPDVDPAEKKTSSVFKKFMNLITVGKPPAVAVNEPVKAPTQSSSWSFLQNRKTLTESTNITRKYASQAHLSKRRASVAKTQENSSFKVDAVRRSPRLHARPALKPVNLTAGSQIRNRIAGMKVKPKLYPI